MEKFITVDRHNIEGFDAHPANFPGGYVIVVNKPYEWTSADVVRKIKFSLQRRYSLKNIKVGHAGTLDPLATGVLAVCVGKATKISESLQSQPKEYRAEITFGATTPSFDMETEVDAVYPYKHITEEMLGDALAAMTGEQEQYPPVYSAKYVDGIRAYEKARLGEEVELKSSNITIYEARLVSYESPRATISVRCSKGTYIRAIARDLGAALGSGGYLSGLVRTSSGSFDLQDSLTLEDLSVKLF